MRKIYLIKQVIYTQTKPILWKNISQSLTIFFNVVLELRGFIYGNSTLKILESMKEKRFWNNVRLTLGFLRKNWTICCYLGKNLITSSCL